MNIKSGYNEMFLEINEIVDKMEEIHGDIKGEIINQLTKDEFLAIIIKKYGKFKKLNIFDERYKFEVISKINQELESVEKVDKDNIFEIIALFHRENPAKGSLAHWTGLDNLKKYAQFNIEDACNKWNNLLDESISLEDRINSFSTTSQENQIKFKEKYGTNFKVALDAIAYILTSFSPNEYAVYKKGIYDDFFNLLGIEKTKSNYGEIYKDYIITLKIITEVLFELGHTENKWLLNGQDLIYWIVNYDSFRIEVFMDYLNEISLKLSYLNADDNNFINYLNTLPSDYFKDLVTQYENDTKINGIRWRTSKHLYEGSKITLSKYKEIKEAESEKFDTAIMHAWSNYGVLFPLFYDRYKVRISKIQDKIIDIMKSIDPKFEQYNSHKVGFEGSRNMGSLECWVTIFPENVNKHQDAKQLFASIEKKVDKKETIKYGYIPGANIRDTSGTDFDLVEANNFNYADFAKKLKNMDKQYFSNNNSEINKVYFVGAMIHNKDLSDEFIEKGIWRNGYEDRFIDDVKNIEPGAHIVIKSTYTKKNNLPFDVNEEFVSVLGIKAIGRVISNPKDGENLFVNWEKFIPIKEWYFFTMRAAVWTVERQADDWRYGALIDFVFNEQDQNIQRFLEHPYWADLYNLDNEPTVEKEKVDFTLPISIDSLYFEDKANLERQISVALQSGKSIILIGPPGTGKSKLAQIVAETYGVSYKMVTAMSDWSSYDTIGGYKPNQDGVLYFVDGIFLSSLKNNVGVNTNKWLIIDEINRADIDKAFGPFFSALSGDDVELGLKDNSGNPIELILEKNLDNKVESMTQEYIIPDDWRILGTMNTFDKTSLYEMSYAFMRRFAFIQVPIPKIIDVKLVSDLCKIWKVSLSNQEKANISTTWMTVNKYRKVGPALIEDIAKFIEIENDYTSTIIMYVLPQFEGVFDDELVKFYKELKKLDFINDKVRLKNSIEDFFNISLGDE